MRGLQGLALAAAVAALLLEVAACVGFGGGGSSRRQQRPQSGGDPDGGSAAAAYAAAKPGCSAPVGRKWDRWDMAGSTYNYCYAGCHMDWLINNSARLDLGAYAGVVGVDHYWTGQGVPCGPDGLPHEFDMQDALATTWKAQFPGMRFLSYRITSAVPYDAVIHDKIVSDPDYFIRWEHLPGSTSPGNGSVCFNHLSPCFNDPRRINAPQRRFPGLESQRRPSTCQGRMQC
jgi:hypothetical protein